MAYVIDPEEPAWVRKVLPVPKKARPWNGMIKKRTRKLNSRFWGKTPPNIQAHIASFLPLPSICRFKTVSKEWRSAINQSIVPKQEWYIRAGHSCIYLMDGTAKVPSWRRLSLHIPRNLTRSSWNRHYTSSLSVCGLSGLILIHSGLFDSHDFVAFVCNPLMLNSWIQLPSPPNVTSTYTRKMIIYLGIQEQGTARGQFIVVCLKGFHLADSHLYEIVVQVYDSKQSEWVSSKKVPTTLFGATGELIQNGKNCMILRDNKITFITALENGLRSLKYMDVWDPTDIMTLATWTTLPLNMYQSRYYTLLELRKHAFPGYCRDGNRLVLAGGKFVLVNKIPVSNERVTLGLLFLNDNNEWQALTSLPLDNLPWGFKEGVKKEDAQVDVGGGERVLTFYFMDLGWGCVYNMITATWVLVYGRSPHGDGDVFYSYQPSFTTLDI